MEPTNSWNHANTNVFWGEIAPSDHVVQIYEDTQVFIDMLEGYVSGGIKAGDCVIVIATSAHLTALETRLKADGFNVFDLALRDQYIPLDAEETLAKFMIGNWPDPNLFRHMVTGLIHRAKRNKRPVRAFGEMVALLWAKGSNGATVQLEHLWNNFCETESLTLFCAYPKSGFTENASESIMHICSSHSKMIAGFGKVNEEILYQDTGRQDSVHKKTA
jgi:hypothetical protein